MTVSRDRHPGDTAALRKARGAFFTPDAIASFIVKWAVRGATDRVLEPSAGDAAFLVAAVNQLHEVSGGDTAVPVVDGVEIDSYSARSARARVRAAGGDPRVRCSDFFLVEPSPQYDAVIGNPPFIRYQDFAGQSRARSRLAALNAGVALSGLASSWAAFAVHSALFLKSGGRLGLVLPAELLSVNYAAPVRRFLFDNFADVQLVVFDEQVFPEAEADVVLLLADGYKRGPTTHATIRQARNTTDLAALDAGQPWSPLDPAGKWTGSLVDPTAVEPLHTLLTDGRFTTLEAWGDTTLGMVTGNNSYFTLSPQRVQELGLTSRDLLRVSPPGSSHLRGLTLSRDLLTRLGAEGKSTYLFSPRDEPSPAAASYIAAGHHAGVDTAYKCRVRKTWWRVPLIAPADLLLTCMNADTPRLTTNTATVRHLNSVHGVYLGSEHRELGRELLPLASLNSVTLLNAEMVGRAYGGGILKLEPKEADVWAMPSPSLIATHAEALRAIKTDVARKLRDGKLFDAVSLVDGVLLTGPGHITAHQLGAVRTAHQQSTRRRTVRGASGR